MLHHRILQLELDERNEVGTRVIVRQNKTNFGAPQVPFVVQTLFEEKKIVLQREALSEEDLREESVLNATDRVLLSFLDGSSYPADLQEKTGLAGVGNIITKLKCKELVELTGQKVGKADEVRLTEKGQGLAEVIRSQLSSSLSNPLGMAVMMKENLRRPRSPRAPKRRKSSDPS